MLYSRTVDHLGMGKHVSKSVLWNDWTYSVHWKESLTSSRYGILGSLAGRIDNSNLTKRLVWFSFLVIHLLTNGSFNSTLKICWLPLLVMLSVELRKYSGFSLWNTLILHKLAYDLTDMQKPRVVSHLESLSHPSLIIQLFLSLLTALRFVNYLVSGVGSWFLNWWGRE